MIPMQNDLTQLTDKQTEQHKQEHRGGYVRHGVVLLGMVLLSSSRRKVSEDTKGHVLGEQLMLVVNEVSCVGGKVILLL